MKFSKFVSLFLTLTLCVEPVVPLHAATPLSDNQNPTSQAHPEQIPGENSETPSNSIQQPAATTPESTSFLGNEQPLFVSTPAPAGAEFAYSYSNSPELSAFLARPNTNLTSGSLGRSASLTTIQIDGECAPANRSTADACTVSFSNILSQTERFTSISVPLFWASSLPNPRTTSLSSSDGWFQNFSGGNGRITIGGSDIYTIRYAFDPSEFRPKLSQISFEDQTGQTILTLQITAPVVAASPSPSPSATGSPIPPFVSVPSPAPSVSTPPAAEGPMIAPLEMTLTSTSGTRGVRGSLNLPSQDQQGRAITYRVLSVDPSRGNGTIYLGQLLFSSADFWDSSLAPVMGDVSLTLEATVQTDQGPVSSSVPVTVHILPVETLPTPDPGLTDPPIGSVVPTPTIAPIEITSTPTDGMSEITETFSLPAMDDQGRPITYSVMAINPSDGNAEVSTDWENNQMLTFTSTNLTPRDVQFTLLATVVTDEGPVNSSVPVTIRILGPELTSTPSPAPTATAPPAVRGETIIRMWEPNAARNALSAPNVLQVAGAFSSTRIVNLTLMGDRGLLLEWDNGSGGFYNASIDLVDYNNNFAPLEGPINLTGDCCRGMWRTLIGLTYGQDGQDISLRTMTIERNGNTILAIRFHDESGNSILKLQFQPDLLVEPLVLSGTNAPHSSGVTEQIADLNSTGFRIEAYTDESRQFGEAFNPRDAVFVRDDANRSIVFDAGAGRFAGNRVYLSFPLPALAAGAREQVIDLRTLTLERSETGDTFSREFPNSSFIFEGVTMTHLRLSYNEYGDLLSYSFEDSASRAIVTVNFPPVEIFVTGRMEARGDSDRPVFDPPAGLQIEIDETAAAPDTIEFVQDSSGGGLNLVVSGVTYRLDVPSHGVNANSQTFSLPPAGFPGSRFLFRGQEIVSGVMNYDDAGNPRAITFKNAANQECLTFVFPQRADISVELELDEALFDVITRPELELDAEPWDIADEDPDAPAQNLPAETQARMQSALNLLSTSLQMVMRNGEIDSNILILIDQANRIIRDNQLLNPDESVSGDARRAYQQFANSQRTMLNRIRLFSNILNTGQTVSTPLVATLPENYRDFLAVIENAADAGNPDLRPGESLLQAIRLEQLRLQQLARDRDALWQLALSQPAARNRWTSQALTLGGRSYSSHSLAYETEIAASNRRISFLMTAFRQTVAPQVRTFVNQLVSERAEAPALPGLSQDFRNGLLEQVAYLFNNINLETGQDMNFQLSDLRLQAAKIIQTAAANGNPISQSEQGIVLSLIDILQSIHPDPPVSPAGDVSFQGSDGVTRTGTMRLGEFPAGTVRSENPFTGRIAGHFEAPNYTIAWTAPAPGSTEIRSTEIRNWTESGQEWMELRESTGPIRRQKGIVVRSSGGQSEWIVSEVEYQDGTVDRGNPPSYDLMPEFLRQAMTVTVPLPNGQGNVRVILPSITLENNKKLTFVNPYLMEIRQESDVVAWQVNLESLKRISLGDPAARMAEARRIAQGILSGGNNAILTELIASTMGQNRYNVERSTNAQFDFAETLTQFLLDLTGRESGSQINTVGYANYAGRSSLGVPGDLTLTIGIDRSTAQRGLTLLAEYKENGTVTRRIPAFFGRKSDARTETYDSGSQMARSYFGLIVLQGYRAGARTNSGPYLDQARTMSGYLEREYTDLGGLSIFATANWFRQGDVITSSAEMETRYVMRNVGRETVREFLTNRDLGQVGDWSFRPADWVQISNVEIGMRTPSLLGALGESLASNPVGIPMHLLAQGSSGGLSMLRGGAANLWTELFDAVGWDAVNTFLTARSDEINFWQSAGEAQLRDLQRGIVPGELQSYLDAVRARPDGIVALDAAVRLRRGANTRPDSQVGARPGTRQAVIDAPVSDAERVFELVRWRNPAERYNLMAQAGEDPTLNGIRGFGFNLVNTLAENALMIISMHFIGALGAAAGRVPFTAEAAAAARAATGMSSISRANIFTRATWAASTTFNFAMLPNMAVTLPNNIVNALNAFGEGRYQDFSEAGAGAIMDGIFTFMMANGFRQSISGRSGTGSSHGTIDASIQNLANRFIDRFQGWRPGTSAALMPLVGAIPRRIHNQENRQALVVESERVDSIRTQIENILRGRDPSALNAAERTRYEALNEEMTNTLTGMRIVIELDSIQRTLAEAANASERRINESELEAMRRRANDLNRTLERLYPELNRTIEENASNALEADAPATFIERMIRRIEAFNQWLASGAPPDTRPANRRSGRRGELRWGEDGSSTPPATAVPEASEGTVTPPPSSTSGTGQGRNGRAQLGNNRSTTVHPQEGQIIRFEARDPRTGEVHRYEYHSATREVYRVNGELLELMTFEFEGVRSTTIVPGRTYRFGTTDAPVRFRVFSEGDVAAGGRYAGNTEGAVRFTNSSGRPVLMQAAVPIPAGAVHTGPIAAGEKVAVTLTGQTRFRVQGADGKEYLVTLNPTGTPQVIINAAGNRARPATVEALRAEFEQIFEIRRGTGPGSYVFRNLQTGEPLTVTALGEAVQFRRPATMIAPGFMAPDGTPTGDVFHLRLVNSSGEFANVRYWRLPDGRYQITYPDSAGPTGARRATMSQAVFERGFEIPGLANLRLRSDGRVQIENLTGRPAELALANRLGQIFDRAPAARPVSQPVPETEEPRAPTEEPTRPAETTERNPEPPPTEPEAPRPPETTERTSEPPPAQPGIVQSFFNWLYGVTDVSSNAVNINAQSAVTVGWPAPGETITVARQNGGVQITNRNGDIFYRTTGSRNWILVEPDVPAVTANGIRVEFRRGVVNDTIRLENLSSETATALARRPPSAVEPLASTGMTLEAGGSRRVFTLEEGDSIIFEHNGIRIEYGVEVVGGGNVTNQTTRRYVRTTENGTTRTRVLGENEFVTEVNGIRFEMAGDDAGGIIVSNEGSGGVELTFRRRNTGPVSGNPFENEPTEQPVQPPAVDQPAQPLTRDQRIAQSRNQLIDLLVENADATGPALNRILLEFFSEEANRAFRTELIGPQGATETVAGYRLRAAVAANDAVIEILQSPRRPRNAAELADLIRERIANRERLTRERLAAEPAPVRRVEVRADATNENPQTVANLDEGAVELRIGQTLVRVEIVNGEPRVTVANRVLTPEEIQNFQILGERAGLRFIRNEAGEIVAVEVRRGLPPPATFAPRREDTQVQQDTDPSVSVPDPSGTVAPPATLVLEPRLIPAEGTSTVRIPEANESAPFRTPTGEEFSVSRSADGELHITTGPDGAQQTSPALDVNRFEIGNRRITIEIGADNFMTIRTETILRLAAPPPRTYTLRAGSDANPVATNVPLVEGPRHIINGAGEPFTIQSGPQEGQWTVTRGSGQPRVLEAPASDPTGPPRGRFTTSNGEQITIIIEADPAAPGGTRARIIREIPAVDVEVVPERPNNNRNEARNAEDDFGRVEPAPAEPPATPTESAPAAPASSPVTHTLRPGTDAAPVVTNIPLTEGAPNIINGAAEPFTIQSGTQAGEWTVTRGNGQPQPLVAPRNDPTGPTRVRRFLASDGEQITIIIEADPAAPGGTRARIIRETPVAESAPAPAPAPVPPTEAPPAAPAPMPVGSLDSPENFFAVAPNPEGETAPATFTIASLVDSAKDFVQNVLSNSAPVAANLPDPALETNAIAPMPEQPAIVSLQPSAPTPETPRFFGSVPSLISSMQARISEIPEMLRPAPLISNEVPQIATLENNPDQFFTSLEETPRSEFTPLRASSLVSSLNPASNPAGLDSDSWALLSQSLLGPAGPRDLLEFESLLDDPAYADLLANWDPSNDEFFQEVAYDENGNPIDTAAENQSEESLEEPLRLDANNLPVWARRFLQGMASLSSTSSSSNPKSQAS